MTQKEQILAVVQPVADEWMARHRGQDGATTMADLIVTIMLAVLEVTGVMPAEGTGPAAGQE